MILLSAPTLHRSPLMQVIHTTWFPRLLACRKILIGGSRDQGYLMALEMQLTGVESGVVQLEIDQAPVRPESLIGQQTSRVLTSPVWWASIHQLLSLVLFINAQIRIHGQLTGRLTLIPIRYAEQLIIMLPPRRADS